jgi:hypothetical protein
LIEDSRADLGTSVKMVQPDKYAKDARAWRDLARFTYTASRTLFTSDNNIVLCFPAATLGHHALEMFLKAALICEGFTVFNPSKIKELDPSVSLTAADCAWGHKLVVLARQLARKRPDFDLSDTTKITGYWYYKLPMTVERGFAMFDPFFSELRYPQALRKLEGVGPDDVVVLDALVAALRPFITIAP